MTVPRRMIAAALGIALWAIASHAKAAQQIGPTLRELVEVADIESVAAAPDGLKVAFRVQRPSIAANSYRIDWYVADLATGTVRHVADGGAPIYRIQIIESEVPVWSPDSRAFYRRAMVNGAIGLWRTSADGSGSRLAVGGPANVESLSADRGGRSLSYVTGPTRAEVEAAERKEYDDGILIDATIEPYQGLYRAGWEEGRLASERLMGEWYSRAGLLWRIPRTRHRLDLVTETELGRETVPPPKVGVMSPDLTRPPLALQLASGGKVTVVGADADQHLEYTGPHGETASCSSAACLGSKIVTLVQRPGTNQILFTRQDLNFRQTLYLWDIATNRVRRLAGGEGQLSGGREGTDPCTFGRSSIVCVEAASASPPRLVRIDLATGREAHLYDPNARMRSHQVPNVEQLTMTLDDGRTASGTLFTRPGATPARAPLFVTYYYCPGYVRGGFGDSFPLEPLVDAGFVVACLNAVPFKVWGATTNRYRDGLASVSKLVRLLDKRGWIDPARVGMGGLSMGSEVTMWTAMNSNLLAAAAIVSLQIEPDYYWMQSVRGRDVPKALMDMYKVGSPIDDPAGWKTLSPALNTDRIKAPLLMQLPEQEFRSVMELYTKLTYSTTPVELYAFPDEGHVKLQPRHQFATYQRNLQWFRYWLQDYVDPDPAFAAQYHRWNLLRQRREGLAK